MLKKKTRLRTFIDAESGLLNSFLKNKNNIYFNQKKKKLNFYTYLASYIKFLKKYTYFLRVCSYFLKNKKLTLNLFKTTLLKKKYNSSVNTFKLLNLETKYVCTFNSSVKYRSNLCIFNKNFILFNKNSETNEYFYSIEEGGCDNNVVNNIIYEIDEGFNKIDTNITENIGNNEGGEGVIIENDVDANITGGFTSKFFKSYIDWFSSNNLFFCKSTTKRRFFSQNKINSYIKKEFKNLFNFYMHELFFKQYLKYFKNSSLMNKPITIKFKLLNIFSKNLIIIKKYKNLSKDVKLTRLYATNDCKIKIFMPYKKSCVVKK